MSDDLISRQALLNKFEPWLKVKDYNDGELNMLKAVLYEIRFMPSVTDKNVGTKFGTDLAEVGTDCISRQQAIDALLAWMNDPEDDRDSAFDVLKQLPSAQHEIIRCRECKFASGDSRICMKFDHSPIGELDFCSFAERIEVNNESN